MQIKYNLIIREMKQEAAEIRKLDAMEKHIIIKVGVN